MKKLLLVALCFWIDALQAQYCIGNAHTYTLGTGWCVSLTAADYNNDNKKDLAVCNSINSQNQITILTNNGLGYFSIGGNWYALQGGSNLLSADFNNDNNQDIAAQNDSLAILLGVGNGTFSAPTRYSLDPNAKAFIAGDFNTDGYTDVVVTNYASNSISVLLGTGSNGNLNPANNSPFVGGKPHNLVSDDFNADGKLDLAILSDPLTSLYTYSVTVLLGTGTGTFNSAFTFSPGNQPASISSADFNGDNKRDLAIVNSGGQNVVLALGQGNGHFNTPTIIASGGNPKYGTCDDYNGDGKMDIAVADAFYSYVDLYYGKGNGTFTLPAGLGSGCYFPNQMISSDLNADGKPDLAVVNSANTTEVMLNCLTPPTCSAYVTDSLYNISPLNWGLVAHYSPQITSAIWYWGDGTSTAGFYPSHTYGAAGNYNICVKAYTSCGDSINTCRTDSLYRVANNNNSMVNINIVPTATVTTGIREQVMGDDNILIYPNPSGSRIFIDVKTQSKLRADVYDVNGKQVLSTIVSNLSSIDVSDLNEGVYTLTLSTSGFVKNKKLVIIK